MLTQTTSLRGLQPYQKIQFGADGSIGNVSDQIGHRMLFHLLSACRRDGPAYASKEQAQVLVYLGRCSYGTPRIAAYHALLDGNGRRHTGDQVALRLAHPSQKLTCIGRQALHVTSLAFRIERIESQRTLARTGQSGHHDQLAPRYSQRYILQIIDACPFDDDGFATCGMLAFLLLHSACFLLYKD